MCQTHTMKHTLLSKTTTKFANIDQYLIQDIKIQYFCTRIFFLHILTPLLHMNLILKLLYEAVKAKTFSFHIRILHRCYAVQLLTKRDAVRCFWRLESSEMCCVTGWVAANISESHSTFRMSGTTHPMTLHHFPEDSKLQIINNFIMWLTFSCIWTVWPSAWSC